MGRVAEGFAGSRGAEFQHGLPAPAAGLSKDRHHLAPAARAQRHPLYRSETGGVSRGAQARRLLCRLAQAVRTRGLGRAGKILRPARLKIRLALKSHALHLTSRLQTTKA